MWQFPELVTREGMWHFFKLFQDFGSLFSSWWEGNGCVKFLRWSKLTETQTTQRAGHTFQHKAVCVWVGTWTGRKDSLFNYRIYTFLDTGALINKLGWICVSVWGPRRLPVQWRSLRKCHIQSKHEWTRTQLGSVSFPANSNSNSFRSRHTAQCHRYVEPVCTLTRFISPHYLSTT
jgi:hypothetical protein